MFQSCIPWLSAACGVGFCCFSVAEDVPDEPSVAVSMESWGTTVSYGPKRLSFSHAVWENSSWKIAYCEEEMAALSIKDSEGSSASSMECTYDTFLDHDSDARAGMIHMDTGSWVPSRGATWVEVKGKIPFIMYRESTLSDGVVLKLVKGASAPLVLKGGGADGKDVNVTLEVGECKPEPDPDMSKHLRVTLKLVSPVNLGFLDFEFQTKEGTPVPATLQELSCDGHTWEHSYTLDDSKATELNVLVRFAAGLRKIMVPVNTRCGLFGLETVRDVQRKGK